VKIVEPGEGFGAIFHFPHVLGFDVAGVVEVYVSYIISIYILSFIYCIMQKDCKECKRIKVGDEIWADLGKVIGLDSVFDGDMSNDE
jgi:hypothetical protein